VPSTERSCRPLLLLAALLLVSGVAWVVVQGGTGGSGPECDGRLRCDPLLTWGYLVWLLLPVGVAGAAHGTTGPRASRIGRIVGISLLLPPLVLSLLGGLSHDRPGLLVVAVSLGLLVTSLLRHAGRQGAPSLRPGARRQVPQQS
jgi:hypothetical protein